MTCVATTVRTGTVAQDWVTDATSSGGVVDAYAGKRRHTRVTWGATLLVQVLAGRNADEMIHAKAKDVSLGGVAFISRKKLANHTPVEIWAEGYEQSITGTVRHCTMTLSGYIVGVEFAESGGGVSRIAG
jgi:hypothetical protein